MEEKADKIRKVLNFDALNEAEQITGKTYKEDEFTSKLGFAMHLATIQDRYNMLEEMADTTFSMKIHDWIFTIEINGFKPILHDNHFYIHYKEPGLVLLFDEYEGNRNGATLLYNWVPKDEDYWEYVESGSFWLSEAADAEYKQLFENYPTDKELEKKVIEEWRVKVLEYYKSHEYVWIGSHDAREALFFHIEQLEKHGEFISPWKKQPFLCLLDWTDTKVENYDYEAINARRISMLSKEIQEVIGPQGTNHWL